MVTGANGQLGSEIRSISKGYPFQFYFLDINELDITNQTAVENFINSNDIDAIINCAAYTAVDKAESEPVKADLINNLAVGYLVQAIKEKNVKFIHISTDYVFDGESFKPYLPQDNALPRSVYGLTKRSGEKNVINSGIDNAMIIRTSWVYSSFGNNFVKTILRLANERKKLNVVNDQIGSPTYARDLAIFLLENLGNINWSGTKVFHFTNEGVCSWFDFAKMICNIRKIECEIRPIPSSEYPTPASRPFYSVLSKEELKTSFNYEIPYWLDSLKDCLEIIDSN